MKITGYKYDNSYSRNRFVGPGLSAYETSRGVDDHDRESICRMLARAFEAGRKAQAKEIRDALGVHDTPWGVKVG